MLHMTKEPDERLRPSLRTTLNVFWDWQGPVLEHYQERGTTINSAWYSEMLTDRLKPAIRSKCQVLQLKGVELLHDDARLHTAETLQKLKFEVMAHPPIVLILPHLTTVPLVWSTQWGIKGPFIYLRARSEERSAGMVRCSAKNLLFGGHQEACATMDQVRWKSKGLCWKMMLM